MAGPDLLDRIDRIMAELAALRAEVAGAEADEKGICETDTLADDDADFRPHLMLWPSEAAARFGFAIDTVRYLCRVEGLGRKYGHRWRASIPRFQRYVNSGG